MDEYANRQAERDRGYCDSWETPEARKWITALPPEELRRLEAEGLLSPMLPKDGVANGCGIEEDNADSPLASVDAPRVSASDSLDAILADYPHLEAAIEERARQMAGGSEGKELIRRLIGELLNQGNAKLSIECLALVTGIGFNGDSMVDIARRHGISRSGVSKRCVELTEALDLPPSRAMRALTARKAYAETQHKIRRSHEQRNNRSR